MARLCHHENFPCEQLYRLRAHIIVAKVFTLRALFRHHHLRVVGSCRGVGLELSVLLWMVRAEYDGSAARHIWPTWRGIWGRASFEIVHVHIEYARVGVNLYSHNPFHGQHVLPCMVQSMVSIICPFVLEGSTQHPIGKVRATALLS